MYSHPMNNDEPIPLYGDTLYGDNLASEHADVTTL